MPLIVGLVSLSHLVRFWVAFDVCVLFQVAGVKWLSVKGRLTLLQRTGTMLDDLRKRRVGIRARFKRSSHG